MAEAKLAILGNPLSINQEVRETREESFQQLVDRLKEKAERIKLGGGEDRIRREHERGKLTARERVERLLDSAAEWFEIGLFAADGMYIEEGGCPAAGVICGVGRISGRLCVVVANDATVKAGAWFPLTVKKILRAQEIALENEVPIVYLVDSAGIYLPLQDEVFADRDHFGRVFRNNAVLSSKGIPQISAIMGSCVAGGAYLPVMSDEALIVDGAGSLFLAGPYLVKAAIGEVIDSETLGGATTHSTISGVTDHQMKDDASCIERIRELIARMGPRPRAGFERAAPVDPAYPPEEIPQIFPGRGDQPYDMREVLARIVDRGSWMEYKQGYGQTILTGYARIDGWSVGIVANQRLVVKTKTGEMQVGGVIYSDSADKAARFVMNCNQKRIPIVFFQDVTGFMVGRRAEHGGIIKDGAKLVNAVANSVVPKFTVIVGNSYGAGNYAMCGRAYDPRLMLAWPTARIAVMGGSQAAETLLQIQESRFAKKSGRLSEKEREAILAGIMARYEQQMQPTYAAARLWVDEIVLPTETRSWLSMGIELADHNPHIPHFNPGVIQT